MSTDRAARVLVVEDDALETERVEDEPADVFGANYFGIVNENGNHVFFWQATGGATDQGTVVTSP